jgi:hypothetical protein
MAGGARHVALWWYEQMAIRMRAAQARDFGDSVAKVHAPPHWGRRVRA